MGHRGGVDRALVDGLVAAGYVVVSIDYRLAPEVKLPAIIEDVRDACRWVRDRGPELFRVAPDRIAVMGASAGGYLTLVSGYAVEPRPKALVAYYGYGDVAGAWYSRPDPFYRTQPLVPDSEARAGVGGAVRSETATNYENRRRFYLYCRQQGLWPKEVAGIDPDKEPKAFDPFCPVRNVTAAYPPTLLIHGTKDTDVPYEQSEIDGPGTHPQGGRARAYHGPRGRPRAGRSRPGGGRRGATSRPELSRRPSRGPMTIRARG